MQRCLENQHRYIRLVSNTDTLAVDIALIIARPSVAPADRVEFFRPNLGHLLANAVVDAGRGAGVGRQLAKGIGAVNSRDGHGHGFVHRGQLVERRHGFVHGGHRHDGHLVHHLLRLGRRCGLHYLGGDRDGGIGANELDLIRPPRSTSSYCISTAGAVAVHSAKGYPIKHH